MKDPISPIIYECAYNLIEKNIYTRIDEYVIDRVSGFSIVRQKDNGSTKDLFYYRGFVTGQNTYIFSDWIEFCPFSQTLTYWEAE